MERFFPKREPDKLKKLLELPADQLSNKTRALQYVASSCANPAECPMCFTPVSFFDAADDTIEIGGEKPYAGPLACPRCRTALQKIVPIIFMPGTAGWYWKRRHPLRVSVRGFPLIWDWSATHHPFDACLTVEDYSKWYGLCLVHTDGRVEEIPFPDESWAMPGETVCGDHVPNPAVVQRFASKKGYAIDERAFEVIVGRWRLEHEGAYDEQ